MKFYQLQLNVQYPEYNVILFEPVADGLATITIDITDKTTGETFQDKYDVNVSGKP